MKNWAKVGLFLIGAVLVFLTSGCTNQSIVSKAESLGAVSTSAAPPSDSALQAIALERAKARWARIVEKKFEDTFEFFTPASRRGLTKDDYARRMNTLNVRAAEVVSAECKDGTCTVTVNLTIAQRLPRVGEVPHQIPSEEHWTWSEGQLGLIRR